MKTRTRRLFAGFFLVAAALALAGGVAELFQLRFSAGDIYPPYSTLRADPLGSKALYETLGEQPRLRVERILRPLSRLPSGPEGAPLVLFYLGLDPTNWPAGLFNHEETARLDILLRHGGRLVLAFNPTGNVPTRLHPRVKLTFDEKTSRPNSEDEPVNLARHWAIDFHRIDPNRRAPLPSRESIAKADPATAIEPAASWHSAVDFELDDRALKAGWTSLYHRAGRPVAVARDYPGGGRLVLASDSYLFSNEGLRNEPHPMWISDLIGSVRWVGFDETHFGVAESPGWMTLARRFHLEPALAALGVLVALFLWRSATSLAPSKPEAGADVLAGRDSAAGFLNLVRRSVPARELLAKCVRCWENGASPAAAQRVGAILQERPEKVERGRAGVAATYRAMCAAAHRRK